MSGVVVIRRLLAAHTPLAAKIDPEEMPPRITSDPFGQGVVLPALRVWKVSGADSGVIKPGASRHHRERIQVDVLGSTRREIDEIKPLVLAACGDVRPAVAGLTNVTVVPAGEGPDGYDSEISARSTSHDFIVTYNKAT